MDPLRLMDPFRVLSHRPGRTLRRRHSHTLQRNHVFRNVRYLLLYQKAPLRHAIVSTISRTKWS